MSFAKEVWEKFSTLNVNEHTEKKGNSNFQLTYLSWTWAIKMLFDNYPESEYTFEEDKTFPDDTVEVAVTVTVKDGDKSLSRRMTLPVMDHKNASVKNPTSRHRSDARQRCLVKCLALFGLGLYIYAGEDLPDSEKDKAEANVIEQEIKDMFFAYLASENALGLSAFMKSLPQETQTALFNAFPDGQKTSGKAKARELEKAGFEAWDELVADIEGMMAGDDGYGLMEATGELSSVEKKYLRWRLGESKSAELGRIINESKAAA